MWELIVLVVVVAASLGLAYVGAQLSPWPRALRVRRRFDADGERVNAALARHVPSGIIALKDESYDPADLDAWFDLFLPEGAAHELPLIVWVHGGGWIAGNKNQVENYARILAGRGFAVVTVAYSLAPRKKYPTPLRQVATALRHIVRNGPSLRVDPSRLFLAGDSAGAQIVAQVANLITVESYAKELGIERPLEQGALRGILLFCGRYDRTSPPFGALVTTMLWSYCGHRDFQRDPAFSTFSIVDFVTSSFPPAFITAGNGDALAPHSVALAQRLRGAGVAVDALFFPEQHVPSLPHEYQFNLDSEEGRLALERAVAFLWQQLDVDAEGRVQSSDSQ